MGDAFTRLQVLLRQLFQFESKELDFGIYRILNHKRGAIEDFIRNGLAAMVDDALSGGATARQSARARNCGDDGPHKGDLWPVRHKPQG